MLIVSSAAFIFVDTIISTPLLLSNQDV